VGRLLSQRELDGLVPRHGSSFVEGSAGSRFAEPGTGCAEVALAPGRVEREEGEGSAFRGGPTSYMGSRNTPERERQRKRAWLLTSGHSVWRRPELGSGVDAARNGLKPCPSDAFRAVCSRFGSRCKRVCVVKPDLASTWTTEVSICRNFYGSDGTRTRDLRRDRLVPGIRRWATIDALSLY
jgi:hypothetical protein